MISSTNRMTGKMFHKSIVTALLYRSCTIDSVLAAQLLSTLLETEAIIDFTKCKVSLCAP